MPSGAATARFGIRQTRVKQARRSPSPDLGAADFYPDKSERKPSNKRTKKSAGGQKAVTFTVGGKKKDEEERAQHEEAQFILRLPEDLEATEKFRQSITEGEPPEDFRIRFHSDRRATVTLSGQDYHATLKDLPTVTESWKTYDKVQYWKIADIHQMLVVEGPEPPLASEMPQPNKEEYEMKDGLAPPLKNVVNRRFRKPQMKQVSSERRRRGRSSTLSRRKGRPRRRSESFLGLSLRQAFSLLASLGSCAGLATLQHKLTFSFSLSLRSRVANRKRRKRSPTAPPKRPPILRSHHTMAHPSSRRRTAILRRRERIRVRARGRGRWRRGRFRRGRAG